MISLGTYIPQEGSDFNKKATTTGIHSVKSTKIIELITNDGKSMLGVEYTLDDDVIHVEPFYPNEGLIVGTKFEKISQADLTKMLGFYYEEVVKTADKTIKYPQRKSNFIAKYCDNLEGVFRFFSTRYDISQFIGKLMLIQDIKAPTNLTTQALVEKFLLSMKMPKPYKMKVIAIKKQADGSFELKCNTQPNSIEDKDKSLTFTTNEIGMNAAYASFLAGNSGTTEKSEEQIVLDTNAINSIFG